MPIGTSNGKKPWVNIDYHIEVEQHYYSVPCQLIQKQLDVCLTPSIIECFYKNKRMANYIRNYRPDHHTTVKEHMPKSHQKWAEWTPQCFIHWAEKIRPRTAHLIEAVLSSRSVPQQGFRMGVLAWPKAMARAPGPPGGP